MLIRTLSPAFVVALGMMAAFCAAGWLIATFSPGAKPRAGRWAAACGVLGAAAGFCAGYAMLFDIPARWGDLPWKMPFLAAAAGGVLFAAGRALSGAWAWVMQVAGSLAVAGVIVYGPWHGSEDRVWEGWPWYATGLTVAGLIYAIPRKEATAAHGSAFAVPLAAWLASAGTSFVVMSAVDQRLGRMCILFSVLAGLVCVMFAWRPLRGMAVAAADVLAVMSAAMAATAAYYSDVLPWPVFVLLGAVPAAALVTWLPAVQKRAGVSIAVSVVLAGAMLVYPIMMGVRHMPELP